MISKEEISYTVLEIEGGTAALLRIKSECNDGIILWISGSGVSPKNPAKYICGLEYHGHLKVMEKETGPHTSNQAMLIGAIDCVKRIQKPSKVYLVSPTLLGISTGLKGHGVNGKYVQELCSILNEKECTLTEIKCFNIADQIKFYLRKHLHSESAGL